MQWDGSPNAGFSDAESTRLWLPLAAGHELVNVEVQSRQTDSVLALYRQLLALRRELPALHGGTYMPVDAVPEELFAFHRSFEGEQICVVLNFSDQPVRFVHECVPGSEPLLSTRLQRVEIDGATVSLAPNEGVILRV